MSKVAKIIIDIRDTLNDPEGDRWDNDRLIRSINEAVKDINNKARILRDKVYFNLEGGIHTYKLNIDIQLITRAVVNNMAIPFRSHMEMDAISETWEEDTGDGVKYIVYDRLNRGVIRVYPTPTSSVGDISPEFGFITEIDGFEFDSNFGVITDFSDPKADLILYYIKKPNLLDEQEDEIEIDGIWDKAIKHYVCGNTLRDDKDTQNRQFGNEELQLYQGELHAAMRDSSVDFTSAGQYESNYRKGV